MSAGWVKLHRKVLDNEIFRHDKTAWHVFEVLLIVANHKTGSWSGGIRVQLAELVGEKGTTTYRACKRLEKAKMVTLSSNNKYSTIHICKWSEYQSPGDSSSDNKVTTRYHQSDNKVTLLQELRTKNKERTIKSKSEDVRPLYDFYIEQFEQNPNKYKLTPKRKAKLNARLKDNGLEMVKEAIRRTAGSSFHRGDNDRGWTADLDFIIRSYEQTERLATMQPKLSNDMEFERYKKAKGYK